MEAATTPTLEDVPSAYLEYLEAREMGTVGLLLRRCAFGVTVEAVALVARDRECDVRDAVQRDDAAAPGAVVDARAALRALRRFERAYVRGTV